MWFLANSHSIHDNVFTTKYNKSGKSSGKHYPISFQIEERKKENFGQIFFPTATFSSSYEQTKSKKWSYKIFAGHSLQYSSVKNRRVNILINTAAAEESWCFILISGVMFEAELYDAIKKRSFDLSEFKKERCLNF